MSDNKYEMAVNLSNEFYQRARIWSLVAAGAAFLLFAYFTFDGARFYFGSTVVDATVTGLSIEINTSRNSRGYATSGTSFRAQVEFIAPDGTPTTGKLGTVNGFGFKAEVGQQLRVHYNPEMLEYVRVDQFLYFWMRSIFSAGLIIIALGFSILFARIKPTKALIDHYMNKM